MVIYLWLPKNNLCELLWTIDVRKLIIWDLLWNANDIFRTRDTSVRALRSVYLPCAISMISGSHCALVSSWVACQFATAIDFRSHWVTHRSLATSNAAGACAWWSLKTGILLFVPSGLRNGGTVNSWMLCKHWPYYLHDALE